MLATTPFSFINIYLARKTSRNNAVVDLSESKNSEKRVIKEADFQNFFWKSLTFYFRNKRFNEQTLFFSEGRQSHFLKNERRFLSFVSAVIL